MCKKKRERGCNGDCWGRRRRKEELQDLKVGQGIEGFTRVQEPCDLQDTWRRAQPGGGSKKTDNTERME